MRLLVATAAATLLLATAASAQSPPWQQLPGKVEKSDIPTDDHHAAKADDKAYRSALDGIPQIKDHDPWRSVREAPKTKSPR
jgi:hypothetical protein